MIEGHPNSLDGQGVLGPDIDIALLGTYHVASDDHSLDNLVRVALQDHPIHKCARVSLVGIADDVFWAALCLPAGLPLAMGRKARASPTAQSRFPQLLDNRLRLHLQRLVQAGITAAGDVLIYTLRVYIATPTQYQPELMLEPGKLGNIGCLIRASLQCAQGQFETGIVAGQIASYQAGHHLSRHVSVRYAHRFGPGDDHQWFGMAQTYAADLDDGGCHALP